MYQVKVHLFVCGHIDEVHSSKVDISLLAQAEYACVYWVSHIKLIIVIIQTFKLIMIIPKKKVLCLIRRRLKATLKKP